MTASLGPPDWEDIETNWPNDRSVAYRGGPAVRFTHFERFEAERIAAEVEGDSLWVDGTPVLAGALREDVLFVIGSPTLSRPGASLGVSEDLFVGHDLVVRYREGRLRRAFLTRGLTNWIDPNGGSGPGPRLFSETGWFEREVREVLEAPPRGLERFLTSPR